MRKKGQEVFGRFLRKGEFWAFYFDMRDDDNNIFFYDHILWDKMRDDGKLANSAINVLFNLRSGGSLVVGTPHWVSVENLAWSSSIAK